MCQRRELIALYSKMISKSACCWSFRVFFCLLQVGLGCCRLCLTLTHWVISGCFLLVVGCFQVISCLFQVFSGRCRLFQVVSCLLQDVTGCFRLFLVHCRSFQVVSRFYQYLFRASRIRNLGTHFFLHLITCLRTWSCTSHFVHLKYSIVHACMLMCTYLVMHILQRQKYFRVEGKLQAYSTHHPPRTQSGYSDCFSQRRKQQAGLLSTQNQTTRQLSVNSI